MRSRNVLTTADAHKIMAACKAEAQKNTWAVSIAIVDDRGELLLFERLENASAMTAGIAVGKAQASAFMGFPSKVSGDLIKEHPGFIKAAVGLPLQGGVPVMYRGECVGGIGVSGVQGHEDEHVSSVGAAVVANDS